MELSRLTVIQTLMGKKNFKHYLEIGVFNGTVFFRVKSRHKVAVDPDFAFDAWRKIGKMIMHPVNLFNRYYEATSDAFFAHDAPHVYVRDKVQIALIDGMHEYAFALRDVENTLRYLADDGVIVMHDCNPKQKENTASYEQWKAKGKDAGDWNGDVWKTVVHMRSLRKDINVCVLDCDHGLGIITKGKPENSLSLSVEDIASFTFEDLDAHRQEWLNLKPAEYFHDFVAAR